MYLRNKLLPEVPGTSCYLITGYDSAGKVLFSVKAEGINQTDAQLVAIRELRRTPDGFQKANKVEKIVAELRWRNVSAGS
jgi:hypothetical protein